MSETFLFWIKYVLFIIVNWIYYGWGTDTVLL